MDPSAQARKYSSCQMGGAVLNSDAPIPGTGPGLKKRSRMSSASCLIPAGMRASPLIRSDHVCIASVGPDWLSIGRYPTDPPAVVRTLTHVALPCDGFPEPSVSWGAIPALAYARPG